MPFLPCLFEVVVNYGLHTAFECLRVDLLGQSIFIFKRSVLCTTKLPIMSYETPSTHVDLRSGTRSDNLQESVFFLHHVDSGTTLGL